MSRHDLTRLEGIVAGIVASGQFSIDLTNGHSIRARISGRLRRMHVKVAVGDKVLVGISPYDQSHGLIMSRGGLVAKANP
jgi:translation initiation factor IF-1